MRSPTTVLLLLAPLSVSGLSAVLGTDNTCPSNFTTIDSEAACRAALQVLGIDGYEYNGDEPGGADESWPKGCYHCDGVNGCTDGVWFNAAAAGSDNGGANVICVSESAAGQLTEGGVLFVGDSDVDIWPTEENWPDSYNVGVGGATCKDVKNEANALVDAFAPSWVVLVCGENDLWGASVSNTFNRLKLAVRRLTSAGARVLYIGTKPEPDTTSLHDDYESYDAKVKALAADLAAESGAQHAPLVMLDSYQAFVDLGNPDSLYQNDQLHLSDDGYAHWEAWAEAALADDADPLCEVWRGFACVQNASVPLESPEPQCAADKWSERKCKKKCVGKNKCHKNKCKSKKCAASCCGSG